MKKILKVILIVLVALFIIAFLGQILVQDTPNRDSKVASKIKSEKAVANYETLIKIYQEENKTKEIIGLVEDNCKDISNYFKIKQQNGCSFKTFDEVQWQFHEDGSATATTKYKSLTMGICKDGTINCPEEFPDVQEYKK